MSATTVPQADTDEPPRADRPAVRSLPGDASRLPLYVFIVVDILAIPVFLWIGRRQWFFLDEWDFLATRDGGSASDLLTSHNEHWTTVPIVTYRVLWNLFGLHTYLPYQLVPLLLHVAAAALLLVIIRRAGVNPWIATAAASLFALFGSGSQNVVWGFQVTFVGALAFGLGQICLADHEDRIDWRDFAALGCGLLAVMCSGVGVTMVVVVGVAMFLRRGWVIAAMQTIPLAVIYAAWFSVYGEGQGNAQNSSTPSDVVRFTAQGLRSVYHDMGQLPGVGAIMAAALLVGVGLLWKEWGLRAALQRFGVSVALAIGSVLFIASAGATRADMLGISFATTSRYMYILAAMSLPAIALGTDAIARRWPVVFPVGIVLFILPIPWSIHGATRQNPNLLGDKTVVVAAALPELADVPPETVLAVPTGRAVLRLGWLREAYQAGKLPELSADKYEAAVADWKFRLALDQTFAPVSERCEPIETPISLSLSEGDSFGIKGGPVQALNNDPGGSPYNNVTYYPFAGPTLEVVVPHVNLRLRSVDPKTPASICR